jgi:hypothetical protein
MTAKPNEIIVFFTLKFSKFFVSGFDKIKERTVDLSIFVRRSVSCFTAMKNVGPST